jgi:transcriptional regulator with XRE-family HTH domain
MPSNTFGELIRERRAVLRLSLRAFAEKAEMDSGNASRLERGQSAPPEGTDVLSRVARALQWQKGTQEYEHLVDLAAAAKGRIPQDLLNDEHVAAKLPILFRALRNKRLTKAQLEKLIDSIRRA